MVNLPAVCRSCGFTFGSGIVMENCINSSVSNCSSSCPKCGSMAEVLDAKTDSTGKLHFAKSAYDVLTSPNVAPDTLVRLKAFVAKQQQSESLEVDTFIESFTEEIPELSELSKFLVPTNAGEFYSMLGFLLTLIIFIQTMRGSQKEPTPTVINNYYGSSNPEKAGYEAAQASGGLKRKELCPCGSGKKFKNCHGD